MPVLIDITGHNSGARLFLPMSLTNENENGRKRNHSVQALETLQERFPGSYEASTIAHRTPQVLAATTMFGTFGVFKIYFWHNTPSALPNMNAGAKKWYHVSGARYEFITNEPEPGP